MYCLLKDAIPSQWHDMFTQILRVWKLFNLVLQQTAGIHAS